MPFIDDAELKKLKIERLLFETIALGKGMGLTAGAVTDLSWKLLPGTDFGSAGEVKMFDGYITLADALAYRKTKHPDYFQGDSPNSATKQSGSGTRTDNYTSEQIAKMSPEEKIALGNERTRPEGY